MIDIHSHMLPCVDDGSSSVELSLYLLKEAEKIGVTDMILTPHYKSNYKKTPEELRKIFDDFNAQKTQKGINVNLYLGSEIFNNKSIRSLIKEEKVLTLNNSKYVLVEFAYSSPVDITEVAYGIIREGYIPIIAHVERYAYVTDDDISEVKKMGGLIQVNAGSIVGKCKFRLKKRVKKLIKQSLVDFIASDAHKGRKNYLRIAYDYVQKKFGKQCASELFIDNAKIIIGQA